MKTYIEVFLKYPYSNQEDFIDLLRQFSQHSDGWDFLETKSEEYSSSTRRPSCLILKSESQIYRTIAITNKHQNTFYIANIIPKGSSPISIAEYNNIATEFVNDFRRYIRQISIKIEVKTTNEKVELKNIITGDKSRQLFEKYLALFPRSYHPLDIERLDSFICYLSRHAKTTIDLSLLMRWLIEEKEWFEKDALWCVDRIRTGLKILEVNRKL